MEKKDLVIIEKSDGSKYSVRRDRHRYLFPQEWEKLEKTFSNPKHFLLYYTLLSTGARIMEALHLRAGSFNEKGQVEIDVVKHKVDSKSYSLGSIRRFFVPEKYMKKVRKYIKENNLKKDDYLFLDNSKLPQDYHLLKNTEKKKYYEPLKVSYSAMFKRHLKKAQIENPYQLSLHNLRKTFGMWGKLYKTDSEVCYMMGHDMKTHMKHYGSASLFEYTDKIKIKNILGEWS